MRVVNFAHGEMTVLSMYGTLLAYQYLGLDPLAAAPVIALILFLFGFALQRGLVNRFIGRPEHEQFLLMLGIATLLTSSMLMTFGPDARNIQPSYAFDSYTSARSSSTRCASSRPRARSSA